LWWFEQVADATHAPGIIIAGSFRLDPDIRQEKNGLKTQCSQFLIKLEGLIFAFHSFNQKSTNL